MEPTLYSTTLRDLRTGMSKREGEREKKKGPRRWKKEKSREKEGSRKRGKRKNEIRVQD